jgi:hypothetical protein
MKNERKKFIVFLRTALPLVELNDYISMNPEKNIKHRLSKERQIAIESVNKRKLSA